MEIKDNEDVKTQTHNYYADFKLRQTIFKFEDELETVQVIAKDKDGSIIHDKTFTMEFINCHINLTLQDKGVKSAESLYEMVKVLKT